MFHMKHFKKYLFFIFFTNFLFSQTNENTINTQEFILKYEKFLKKYEFKIYNRRNKEVGYVNILISSRSISDTSDYFFISQIESYTDIPILFFLGNTKDYEIEYYDRDFVPLRSSLTTFDKNGRFLTIMDIKKDDFGNYRCKIESNFKKLKKKEFIFKPPILTPGNIIPLVSTLWDFDVDKEVKFYFIDKDNLGKGEIKLRYISKTDDGFKIQVILPYFKASFYIYLDKDKNIKYAEGLGLKIYGL